LAHPTADLFASLCRQRGESHPTFVGLIRPCQCAEGFDSPIVVREPEADGPIPLNRIKGVKAKSSVRHIQHDAAIVRLDIDVGVSRDCRSWILAAFRVRHG